MNRKFTSGQENQIGKIAKDAMVSLDLIFEAAQRLVSNPKLAPRLKALFEELSVFGLQVTYDQSLGLRKLIELAVGPANLGNINSDITSARFKLAGTGVRKMSFRVEPYLSGETSEQAAARLTAAGFTLGNTGDLAGFLHDHPTEVEKWWWVFAISEDSRWARSGGVVYVPYAGVDGARRCFRLVVFRNPLCSRNGVLVACE